MRVSSIVFLTFLTQTLAAPSYGTLEYYPKGPSGVTVTLFDDDKCSKDKAEAGKLTDYNLRMPADRPARSFTLSRDLRDDEALELRAKVDDFACGRIVTFVNGDGRKKEGCHAIPEGEVNCYRLFRPKVDLWSIKQHEGDPPKH